MPQGAEDCSARPRINSRALPEVVSLAAMRQLSPNNSSPAVSSARVPHRSPREACLVVVDSGNSRSSSSSSSNSNNNNPSSPVGCSVLRLGRSPQEACLVAVVWVSSSSSSNRRPEVDFSVEASVQAPSPNSNRNSNRNSRAVYSEDPFLEDNSNSSRNKRSSRNSAKLLWLSHSPTNNSSPFHRACGHPAEQLPAVSWSSNPLDIYHLLISFHSTPYCSHANRYR